ncbi:recombination and repair protein RecT [Corynebacterium humireducens NBRC 106098 = DSM 45392]|uniref:Recombination and repair protein RecT n=1 Tax=Corynebacterium humireducens NBRC 106098 = DSM 45392 TaxID=1223515 RepID=A0A0B5D8J4_9CORY|nr:recombination protein RecT [Corynebacterium humireducens]AJE32553.1 recombination and repair protein RecT [Corynebacterium humireducens NBRC 106098 = DSM 45392]
MARDLENRLTQSTTNTPAQRPAVTLADQVRSMEGQFRMAMPRGMEAAQLVRDALTALRQNPQLGECDPATVLGGLMTCAQLGLRPGVLGHAWLLPFWDNKSRTRRAQLVVGYQGLVELAHRSGQIKSLIARTVYANDTFDVDYGLEDKLVHKPVMRGPKGEPIAYYAVAKFTTGGHAFYIMSHDEMLEYRDAHATAKTRDGKVVGPWATNFEGMALKTTVRQLAKWLPKSTEMAQGLEADGSVRVDLTPAAIDYPEHVDGEVIGEPDGQPVEPSAEQQPSEGL